jgi:hypothetical protein
MEMIQLEKIQSKIFTLRGFQVMLDKDLANFYGVKPIRLRDESQKKPQSISRGFCISIE